MIATWTWWAGFLGRLALEIGAVALVAAAAAKWAGGARRERWIWQSALLATALLLGIGLSGQRPRWDLGWIPDPAAENLPRAVGTAVTTPGAPADRAGGTPTGASIDDGTAGEAGRVLWPGMVWLAGSVLGLARLVATRLLLARRLTHSRIGNPTAGAEARRCVEELSLRMGLRRVRVVVWPGLAGPVALGVFRPTVAVPPDFEARFTSAQREAQLAHELAHLAGWDPLWRVGADLVCALAWWHPGAWWARRQLIAASERVADTAATLVPGGSHALAESLVELGRRLADGPTATRGLPVQGVGGRSQLARRVSLLIAGNEATRFPGERRGWRVHGLGCLLALAAAAAPGPGGRSGGAIQLLAATIPVTPGADTAPDTGPTVAVQPDSAEPGRTGVAPAETMPTAAGSPTDEGTVVTLEVKFVEIIEPGAGDLAFDWLFGQSPTNTGSVRTVMSPTHVGQTGNPVGPNLRKELLETDLQTATLNPGQYRALMERLEGRPGVQVTAAPRVSTRSGQQARVAIEESLTVVTGVATNPPGTTAPSVSYRTEQMMLGPAVDVVATLEGTQVRLGVRASMTEFLGYDDPGAFAPVTAQAGDAALLVAQLPLPRVQERRASATGLVSTEPAEAGMPSPDAAPQTRRGATLVLRGPVSTGVTRTSDKVPVLADIPRIGRLFRKEGTQTLHKRLYVFVTPEVVGGK